MSARSQQISNDLIFEITAACVALLVIGGAVGITLADALLKSQIVDPPGWLQTAVGAVIGFYFARRSSAESRLTYLAAMEASNGGTEH